MRSREYPGWRGSWLAAAALCIGLAAAMALRLAIAGPAGNASPAAGAVFAASLLVLAAAAGWRPGRPSLRSAGIGLAGGALLLAVPVALRLAAPSPFSVAGPAGGFPLWAAVMTLIAVAEETLLRGALMGALLRTTHAETAVAVAAVAFALLHVPLYGWSVLPLDLAVGAWLGGLRLLSGGAGAAAVAHLVADVATWWMR